MKSKSSKPLRGERNSPERGGRAPLSGERLHRDPNAGNGSSAANSEGVEHLHIEGGDSQFARELSDHVRGNFNPIVSRAQQKAMYAAKAGHSTLGIPQKVGADFVAAGPASSHLPARKRKRSGY